MADDKSNIHGSDINLISLDERCEVRDWCRKFACTEPDLMQAVHAVGDNAAMFGRG